MKSYYQVRLGSGAKFAQECLAGGFIGADYGIHQNLTDSLPDNLRDFNKAFIPVFLANHLDKTKIAAGLACAGLWTIGKGVQQGDIVISPYSNTDYYIGEVTGDYYYEEGGNIPHRRPIQWFDKRVNRSEMTETLQNSTLAWTTISNVTKYAEEIERLLGGNAVPKLIVTDETVEDPAAFAMEKHLEDFLIRNWSQSGLAQQYNIFEEDGQPVGQQYLTDTGAIDILAISKDKKTLLVIELKRGRASDAVAGQILRYMGYVRDELAEEGQEVRGIVIALEDDQRLRRALSMVPNVEFYRYQISFKLIKG